MDSTAPPHHQQTADGRQSSLQSQPAAASASRQTAESASGSVERSDSGPARSTTSVKKERAGGPPPPPGRRAIQSCAECKRRKVRCDRIYPCTPCTMRGDEATCERPESTLTPALYDTLTGRMATLEEVVRTLQRTVARLEGSSAAEASPATASPGGGAASIASSPAVVVQAPPPEPRQPITSRSDARAERGQPEEEEVALMLEDFAMGFSQNSMRISRQLNPEHTSAPYPSSPEPRGLAPNHPFLIDPQRSMMLVRTYFNRLEWYTKSLHAPSFIAETERLLTFPAHEAVRQARPSFLCCYLLVLCIALHLIEAPEAAALGFSSEQAADLAQRMFTSATSLLWSSDWLRTPSLEFLQAVTLMGVYSYNVDDEADVHWSLLGTAIKVAQNLGLSRLGAESASKKWPEAWKSFRTRETGRRVWWNLVTLDWSHAQAHNGTYCVHPSQNHTAPPSNVNDEDLGDEYFERPMSEYTESSMSIFKLQFVTLYREFVDHITTRQPADYGFIINMDTRICDLIASFPPYFANVQDSPARTPNLEKECILIRITAANRHLRLHRPYLMRGYTDKQYAASTNRCVTSARSVLTLLQIAGQRCPDLFKLWIVLFYGFVASIVAFIDLTRNPSNETRAALHETVALFKHGEQTSAAARNAISLLQGLLAAEQEITPSSSKGVKRRRIDGNAESTEDPFRQVVNRLLLQASTQHDARHSPSGGSIPSPSRPPYDPNSPMPMPSMGLHPPQGFNPGTLGVPTDYTFPTYPGIHAASGLAELFSGDLDGLDGNFGFVDLVQFDPSGMGSLG
ncbi:fungal-specific transcription factor domain-domain-containing protein [Leucosporidium creatinivorum]|uniref:Fungal-specific transcription factor domain-domain-containing protein n=1 Tax=Leucosporidium creatinivorum TaxID=106004 RepID=A0A1Y2G689_9BASI|nr:fungal-specific transcription factor domain-domain-containing protein [Leucosporidium creatinivorum]